MISPKIESENLKKLVEEFLKNSEESENPGEESEGLDSTDRIVNTFKSMLNSIKEKFEQLSDLASDRKIPLRNLSKAISILVFSTKDWQQKYTE